MNALISLSIWARQHGLSRQRALNMIRLGKIPGAERRAVTVEGWYVPADARPDFTDRRKKSVREREGRSARSA